MELFKHEHPYELIDLQPVYPNYEVVYSEEEEEEGEEEEEKKKNVVLITKQDFQCPCDGCGKEITYFHRYYYRCDPCNYSLHKFCGSKLPETLELASHPHTFTLSQESEISWCCSICRHYQIDSVLFYHCWSCSLSVHIGCATKEVVENETIYHPSHRHPLMPTSKEMLAECDACGGEHKGIFYICSTSYHGYFIHKDCAFLSKNLLIIQHIHPLILDYSSLYREFGHKCRLCNNFFNYDLWIYKCEKCRYYTHLVCATSRKELKSGTVKNFEDVDYPDLLLLPFPDQTYSILKHLFFKEIEPTREHETHEMNIPTLHEHPLIQVDTQQTRPASSRITAQSSCHDPMKNVQLLCNGCVRPITSMPFYKCAYDHKDHQCNFVLHESCTRLPSELIYPHHHPQHTLTLLPRVPRMPLGLSICRVCYLICNGFAYSCIECKYSYNIDVNCGFIPDHITHEVHPNHLLSIFKKPLSHCYMCGYGSDEVFTWSCHDCNFYIHIKCALLLPKTIRHKFDKHPMELSYFPVENHKSDYFCEVCEDELNPTLPFYHCHECASSIHTRCSPLILQCERNTYAPGTSAVYEYVNIKFGGIHKIENHPHPLTFLQGIESDGRCSTLLCGRHLAFNLILKCLECNFAVHYDDEEYCKHLPTK